MRDVEAQEQPEALAEGCCLRGAHPKTYIALCRVDYPAYSIVICQQYVSFALILFQFNTDNVGCAYFG